MDVVLDRMDTGSVINCKGPGSTDSVCLGILEENNCDASDHQTMDLRHLQMPTETKRGIQ